MSPGVEPRVAGDAALDHLTQGVEESARILRADEARERLFENFVGAQAQQLRDGVVGEENLALQVGDEDRVGRVGDDDVGVKGGVRLGAVNGGVRRRVATRSWGGGDGVGHRGILRVWATRSHGGALMSATMRPSDEATRQGAQTWIDDMAR